MPALVHVVVQVVRQPVPMGTEGRESRVQVFATPKFEQYEGLLHTVASDADILRTH